jgi:branched-chain amino acid transport system permease protein
MGANTLYLNLLLLLMSMLIIGRVGKEWWPLMGAGALMIVDVILKEFVEWRLAGLGIILVLFIILWPKSLSGFVDLINKKYFLNRKLKKNLA